MSPASTHEWQPANILAYKQDEILDHSLFLLPDFDNSC